MTSTARQPPAGTLYTVGHSTRSLDELVALLKAHGVEAVADVRLIPRSRRYPHFNADALTVSLPERGLRYVPFKDLGGRRRPLPDSPNTGWRNESFRGYADYLETPTFRQAFERLAALATEVATTVMCAEAVPWRCHRSLIGDAALVHGWYVMDLMSATKSTPHKLTPFARVEGTRITYPPAAPAAGEGPGLFDQG